MSTHWIVIKFLAIKGQDISRFSIETGNVGIGWIIYAYFLDGKKEYIGYYSTLEEAQKELKEALGLKEITNGV